MTREALEDELTDLLGGFSPLYMTIADDLTERAMVAVVVKDLDQMVHLSALMLGALTARQMDRGWMHTRWLKASLAFHRYYCHCCNHA